MLTLARQVQIATDHAKGCCARLAGAEVPKWPDDETTFADLRARIAKTLDFVESVAPDSVDGSEDRPIALTAGTRELRFTGQQYLVGFALPNFHFHATTISSVHNA